MHELDHAVKIVCAWHPNLKLDFPMIRETSIFKEIFDQHYNEGLVDGERKGEIRGERKGEQKVLQRQLEKRFGPLAADLKARLLELNSEALDSLATTSLELATVNDLRVWLINATTN